MDIYEFPKNRPVDQLFEINRGKPLLLSQGLSDNCPLVSFFISLSKVSKKVQSKFLSNTIIPGKEDGKEGFFIRKFVPFKLSEEFEFITIDDLDNNSSPKEELATILRSSKKLYYEDGYGSKQMYGPLFMRLIEFVWSKSKKGQLFPLWIIDYLRHCGITGKQIIIKGSNISEQNYNELSHIPETGIGRIGFHEHETNDHIYLRDKHSYAITGYYASTKEIIIANPWYYEENNNQTTVKINLDIPGLTIVLYLLDE